MPDKAELLKRGMSEEGIIDRETHPAFYEYSFPAVETEIQLLGERVHSHFSHVKPSSVYVAVIGNNWVEDGHHRMQDMLTSMQKKGYTIAFEEMHDLCELPADCVAQMRTQASYSALDSGCEFLFMVDTDALMELDTLERLIALDYPVVAPFIHDLEQRHPGLEKHLSGPILEPNTGLYPVMWTVMSVMLFKTKVFNAIGADCWGSHYGINEYILSQKLNHVGHQMYMDTNTVVNIARSPGRPRGQTWEQREARVRSAYDNSRYTERDRRPPPDYDPVFGDGQVMVSGAYEPFSPGRFDWKEPGHNGKRPAIETKAERRRRMKQFEG
jgi:hypothetical protein